MAEFKNSLFGCFADHRLCIITFCVPCWTVGKNAEHFGEDCLTVGLLACLGIPLGPVLRWRLREEKGLEGNLIKDGLIYAILPCCALIQDYREITGETGKELFRESNVGEDVLSSNQLMERS